MYHRKNACCQIHTGIFDPHGPTERFLSTFLPLMQDHSLCNHLHEGPSIVLVVVYTRGFQPLILVSFVTL